MPPKKQYTLKTTTTTTIETTEETTTTTEEAKEKTTEAPVKVKKRPIKKVKLREGIPEKKKTGLNPEREQLIEERVNCEIGAINVGIINVIHC